MGRRSFLDSSLSFRTPLPPRISLALDAWHSSLTRTDTPTAAMWQGLHRGHRQAQLRDGPKVEENKRAEGQPLGGTLLVLSADARAIPHFREDDGGEGGRPGQPPASGTPARPPMRRAPGPNFSESLFLFLLALGLPWWPLTRLQSTPPFITFENANGPQARETAWKRMSDGARSQFAWPHPGLERGSDDSLFSPDPVTQEVSEERTERAPAAPETPATHVLWC